MYFSDDAFGLGTNIRWDDPVSIFFGQTRAITVMCTSVQVGPSKLMISWFLFE